MKVECVDALSGCVTHSLSLYVSCSLSRLLCLPLCLSLRLHLSFSRSLGGKFRTGGAPNDDREGGVDVERMKAEDRPRANKRHIRQSRPGSDVDFQVEDLDNSEADTFRGQTRKRGVGSVAVQGYLAHKKQPPPRTLQ